MSVSATRQSFLKKVAIIDDKVSDRNNLRILLEKHFPPIEIVGEAHSVSTGISLLESITVDLVFMDISLDVGSSFDILNSLNKKGAIHFDIVFITAYNTYEHALKAIQFSALDFIEKPISTKDLIKAIQRFEKKEIEARQMQLSVLLETNELFNKSSQEYVIIKTLKGLIEKVRIEDIVYIEADGSISYVYFSNNRRLPSSYHLGHYKKLWDADSRFFLISHSILLNLNHLVKYNHTTRNIHLDNGYEPITASRRRGTELNRLLKDGFSS